MDYLNLCVSIAFLIGAYLLYLIGKHSPDVKNDDEDFSDRMLRGRDKSKMWAAISMCVICSVVYLFKAFPQPKT